MTGASQIAVLTRPAGRNADVMHALVRRGWAVHALRNGVSEVSVRTIAGWSSGAMVARYTAALSNELAVAEFERLWVKSTYRFK